MSATTLARNAYEMSTKSTGTPRTIEYQVFSQATVALIATEQAKNTDYPGYIRALSKNLELWTILGADMANPDNGLTATLRAQIFYLFEFTRQHTQKLISGGTTLTAEPLIDINHNIMAGLRGETDGQTQ